MEDQVPLETELLSRMGWLVRLRWAAVVVTSLVIGAVFLWLPGRLPVRSLVCVTAVVAGYNAALALLLHSTRRGQSGSGRLRLATPLVIAQVALDLAALASLLHFAGGVENPAVLFFAFHVIIACILLHRTLGFLMSALAIVLVAGLAGFEYAGWLRHNHLPFVPSELHAEPLYLLAYTATLALTFAITAVLVTSIAARLRQREAMLFDSRASCQARSDELAELNTELRRVDAERTRFVVLVTHELRAPIATIHSALELVRGGYTSAEEADDMLGRAQRRSSELLDLIRDLLDHARIRESARSGVRQETPPIRFGDLLQEAVEFIEPEVMRGSLSMELEITAELAEVRMPLDYARLVWANLLSNAVKYNRPGGRIRVTLTEDERHVLGSVSDTGIGIAPQDLLHVFDEFFRAGNAKAVSAHGSGVGMATVRQVLEQWGGNIIVESELGKGTTFRIWLPRA